MSEQHKDYTPRTPLGQRLWEIRQRALAEGMQTLNHDEVLLEVKRRRGEIDEDLEKEDGSS